MKVYANTVPPNVLESWRDGSKAVARQEGADFGANFRGKDVFETRTVRTCAGGGAYLTPGRR